MAVEEGQVGPLMMARSYTADGRSGVGHIQARVAEQVTTKSLRLVAGYRVGEHDVFRGNDDLRQFRQDHLAARICREVPAADGLVVAFGYVAAVVPGVG